MPVFFIFGTPDGVGRCVSAGSVVSIHVLWNGDCGSLQGINLMQNLENFQGIFFESLANKIEI